MTTTEKDWLEKCKFDADLGYYEYEGTHYETIEDIVQSNFFGFCGCGSPELNLEYILEGLEFIDWRLETSTAYPEIKQKELEIFGNEKAAYFFYYWCDKEDLTEHGGSVPGWLSEKGKLVVSILKNLKAKVDN